MYLSIDRRIHLNHSVNVRFPLCLSFSMFDRHIFTQNVYQCKFIWMIDTHMQAIAKLVVAVKTRKFIFSWAIPSCQGNLHHTRLMITKHNFYSSSISVNIYEAVFYHKYDYNYVLKCAEYMTCKWNLPHYQKVIIHPRNLSSFAICIFLPSVISAAMRLTSARSLNPFRRNNDCTHSLKNLESIAWRIQGKLSIWPHEKFLLNCFHFKAELFTTNIRMHVLDVLDPSSWIQLLPWSDTRVLFLQTLKRFP